MFYNDKYDATFLHIPKCGGVYVRENLKKYYGFNDATGKKYISHINHFDFVQDEYHYNNDKDIYCHSIRSKGKYRYYLSHQNINKEKIKNSFKFTFVRNPYEKLLSAYKYLQRIWFINHTDKKIHNTIENINYLTNFNDFIKNYKNLINISYSHAFITQYDQLCDEFGNINFNYIGKTESLDNDLTNILFLLGIKNQPHLSNKNIMNKSEYDTPIYQNYNQEILNFVNNWFKKDFETFDYKIINTIEEFKEFYISKENNKQIINIDSVKNELSFEKLSSQHNINKNIKIPKIIIQNSPKDIFDNAIYNNVIQFLDKNKDYTYYLINYEFGRQLIENNFNRKTLYSFDKLQLLTTKYDFLKYVYLYLYGGIYFDINSTFEINLNELFETDDEYLLIVEPEKKFISQVFIAIKPQHSIIKNMIEEMVKHILKNEENIFLMSESILFTSVLYTYLKSKEIDISLKDYDFSFIINEIIKNKNTLGKIICYEEYYNFINCKCYNKNNNDVILHNINNNKQIMDTQIYVCNNCEIKFNNNLSYNSHILYCKKE